MSRSFDVYRLLQGVKVEQPCFDPNYCCVVAHYGDSDILTGKNGDVLD